MQQMDHRTVIANLDADERATLLETSDAAGLVHLAGHAGVIAITTAWIALGAPLWQMAVVIQGVFLIFLFTALHESIHRTAFQSQWLNDAVATCCGFILFLPARWFRYFHFAHHRYTNEPGKDPELAVPKPETTRQYLAYLSGIPVWLSQARTLLANAKGRRTDDFVPERGRWRVRREAQAHLLGYAMLLALSFWSGSALLFWVWVLPVALGQPFLRAYLLAEHARCPHVANMLENSRTTFTTRLVRFVAWNMPYHAEHHAYPSVPFHKLPAFHALTQPHLKSTERGYVRFHSKFVDHLRRHGT